MFSLKDFFPEGNQSRKNVFLGGYEEREKCFPTVDGYRAGERLPGGRRGEEYFPTW